MMIYIATSSKRLFKITFIMTMLKKILQKILALSLMVAIFSGNSLCFAEVKPVKLGVIDMQNVIVNSLAYIDITKQIEEKNRANISVSEKEQEKLKKRSQELEAQNGSLSFWLLYFSLVAKKSLN